MVTLLRGVLVAVCVIACYRPFQQFKPGQADCVVGATQACTCSTGAPGDQTCVALSFGAGFDACDCIGALALDTKPLSAQAGVAFSPQLAVKLQDANHVQVNESLMTPVSVKLVENDDLLKGTKQVMAMAGVARFTDLHIDTP